MAKSSQMVETFRGKINGQKEEIVDLEDEIAYLKAEIYEIDS